MLHFFSHRRQACLTEQIRFYFKQSSCYTDRAMAHILLMLYECKSNTNHILSIFASALCALLKSF